MTKRIVGKQIVLVGTWPHVQLVPFADNYVFDLEAGTREAAERLPDDVEMLCGGYYQGHVFALTKPVGSDAVSTNLYRISGKLSTVGRFVLRLQ